MKLTKEPPPHPQNPTSSRHIHPKTPATQIKSIHTQRKLPTHTVENPNLYAKDRGHGHIGPQK